MNIATIKSAINKLSKMGYLDAHNDDMLNMAINAYNRGVYDDAENLLRTVVKNYQAMGNKEAARIVADAI